MASRGKRKDKEGFARDEDAEAHAPAKKAAKSADSSDESDDIVVCNTSNNRRVSVRNWKGKFWIDIREFYIKDDKTLPGKKASLPAWISGNLSGRGHAEEIDKAMADLS